MTKQGTRMATLKERAYTHDQAQEKLNSDRETTLKMLPRLPYTCMEWDVFEGGVGIRADDMVLHYEEAKKVVEVLARFYGFIKGD